jgi:hypothetical protein
MSQHAVLPARAWLHRRNKPTWVFQASKRYGELVHVTRQGTVYRICRGDSVEQPYWVRKLVGGQWQPAEREARARAIEFEHGGGYIFPQAYVARQKVAEKANAVQAQVNAAEPYGMFAIFDVLERLYRAGYRTQEQGEKWWLFDAHGEGVVHGESFRQLCVNIILAEL